MEPETVPGGAEGGAAEVNSGGGGLELEADRELLVPGIPNNITLEEIVPKLPWKSLESLASESPAWLHAMRSRELYDARVVYRGLEPLVLIRCRSNTTYDAPGVDCNRDGCNVETYQTLGLYSTRDGFYFELPPLPVCERGIPADCLCVTLDGKIYALGGRVSAFSSCMCWTWLGGGNGSNARVWWGRRRPFDVPP